MAPEQVMSSAPVDARADIYSTAVVLYEVLTGKPPFQGPNGFAVMLAHRNTAPVPPDQIEPAISEALSKAILKALEKEPAQRFQTAAEFHHAIAEAMKVPAAKLPVRPAQARTAAVVAITCATFGGLVAWAGHMTLRKQPVVAATAPLVRPAPKPAPEPPPMQPAMEPPPQPVAVEPPPPKPVRRKRPAPEQSVRQAAMESSPVPDERSAPADLLPAPTPAAAPAPLPEPPPVPVPRASAPAAPLPAAAAPLPEPKKPNVLKRAITKIFGKRDKSKQDQ
jgi:hypothetical protein